MEILRQFARMLGVRNRQFETLTELNFEGLKVRIWRDAPSLEYAQAFDHEIMRAEMLKICQTHASGEWQAKMMDMPKVACVAIVDKDGNGVSAYPDWH